jgi:hypothetical protein
MLAERDASDTMIGYVVFPIFTLHLPSGAPQLMLSSGLDKPTMELYITLPRFISVILYSFSLLLAIKIAWG